MQVLVARGRRVSLLPVRERSRELLIQMGSKVAVVWARERSGFPVKQDRWYVSISSSLNI